MSFRPTSFRSSKKGPQPKSPGLSIKEIKRSITSKLSRIFSQSESERNADPRLKSPVPHLLTSNMAPTEAEFRLIEEAIKTTQSYIDAAVEDLDTAEGIRQNTSNLENLHASLIRFKQTHESLLSITRRIPREILELIFLEVDEDILSHTIPRTAQVCRFWRDVAVSTSGLWTYFDLDFVKGAPDPHASSRMTLFVDLKIQRSRNAQLDIDISASLPSHADHPAFQHLLDCSDRWKVARLHISNSIVRSFDRIRGRVSSLRSLGISIKGPWIDQPFIVFQEAPLLRHAYVYTLSNISLPWSQLLHFTENHGRVTNTEQKISLLTSASGLIIDWATNPFIPTDSFTCVNLQVLRVIFEQEVHAAGLFAKMKVPKLEFLGVEQVHEDITPSLLIMLRSTPSPSVLQRLKFFYDFDHPGTLSALLRLTPNLKQVEINLPHEADLRQFIFHPSGDKAPLIPNLWKLRFIAGSIDGCEDTIKKIASSRCELATNTSDSPETVVILLSFTLEFRSPARRFEQLRLLEDSMDKCEVPADFARSARDLKQAFRSTITLMENMDGVESNLSSLSTWPVNVHHIYHTGIHLTLYMFVHWDLDRIALQDHERSKLETRAKDILKRWEQPILLDIPNRRWGVAPIHSLVYVSIHDDLRSTDPMAIAYGPMELWKPGKRSALACMEEMF